MAFGHLSVALSHAMLDGDGAFDSIDNARKLDEGAVAHQLDDPSAIFGDSGVNELGAVGLESGERAGLILTHQPTVAGNIRTQDRGEPAFNALPCHGCVPRFVLVMGGSLGKVVSGV